MMNNGMFVILLSAAFAGCAVAPGFESDESSSTMMLTGSVEPLQRVGNGHRPHQCPTTPPQRGDLAGCGTATIDGKLTRGEWRHAGSIRFDLNLPGGGTTRARMFVMNDAHNFYAALRFARAAADPGNSFDLEFDVDHNCELSNGDDALVMNPDIGGIVDDFRTDQPPCPTGVLCGLQDTSAGGSNDGDGAFANHDGFDVYEISHPLDSGDVGHDFALHAGDRIGMTTFVRMIRAGSVFPDDFGDTTFPDGGFLDVRIRHCGHDLDDQRDDRDDDVVVDD